VIQVLDKRGDKPFSLGDLELLAIFAAQAAQAIRTTQLLRDLRRILGEVVVGFAAGGDAATLMANAVQRQGTGAESYWRLVDLVGRLREMPEGELALLTALLEATVRHVERPRFSIDRS